MPQRRGALCQTRTHDEPGGEDDGGADCEAEKHGHDLSPLALRASSSMRAFLTSSSMRASSSSDTREASPPRRAATAFVVDPSKNVSTRCFRADRRAECLGTVGM